MKQKPCILFTGGGGAGNEAILAQLGERYELHFADADVEAIDTRIPQDRRHRIPMATDREFPAAMDALCRRLGTTLLIPGVDEELPALSRRDAVSCSVLAPDAVYVALALDKLELMRRLVSLGIDVPRTEAADRAAEIGFPCIVKPRTGRGSRDVRIIDSVEAAAGFCTAAGGPPDAWIAQERLIGDEYTVLMAADRDANLRAIVPVKVGVKRGITVRAATVDDPAVQDACAAIHNALPAAGCYNIQLIRTASGRVAPFEINPRVSTTFVLGVAAGVDPIAIYMSAPGPAPLAPFAAGCTLRRFWRNEIGQALP